MSINAGTKKADILKAYNDSKKKNKELKSTIDDMKILLESVQSQLQELKESNQINVNVNQDPYKIKKIKLMNLSMGQCHLVNERFSMKFNKPFDQIPIRETVFDDFYYRFKQWFDDLDIIILDDEIAEQYGMKFYYEKYGLSENSFLNAMNSDSENMMGFVKNLPAKMQMTFVVEFARQLNADNKKVDSTQKQIALERYIKEKFGFDVRIVDIAEQYRNFKNRGLNI